GDSGVERALGHLRAEIRERSRRVPAAPVGATDPVSDGALAVGDPAADVPHDASILDDRARDQGVVRKELRPMRVVGRAVAAGERRHGACPRIILLPDEARDVLRLNLSKHLRPPVPVPVNVSARALVGSRDVDPFRYRCTVTGTFVRMPTATAPERRAPRGEARRTFLTEAALTVIARVGPD